MTKINRIQRYLSVKISTTRQNKEKQWKNRDIVSVNTVKDD